MLAVRVLQHRGVPLEPVGRLAQRGRDVPGLAVERDQWVPRRGRRRPRPAAVRVLQDPVRQPLGSLDLVGGLPHRPSQPPRRSAVTARRLGQMEDLGRRKGRHRDSRHPDSRHRDSRHRDRRHLNPPRSSSRTHEATAAKPACNCRWSCTRTSKPCCTADRSSVVAA